MSDFSENRSLSIKLFGSLDPNLMEHGWRVYQENRNFKKITRLNLDKLVLTNMLLEGEVCITAKERRRRLEKSPYIPLGAKVLLFFMDVPFFIPESWKEESMGICFDRETFLSPSNRLYVPFMYWHTGKNIAEWKHSFEPLSASSYRKSAVLPS